MQNADREISRLSSRKSIKRFGFREIVLTILLAALIVILSSVVDFSQPLPPWRLPAAGGLIGVILIMCRFRVGKFSPQAMLMVIFWSGYASMSVVSAIINDDNIIGELWQLIGVPAVFFFVIPYYANRNGVVIVAMAMTFGYIPFILASLLFQPIQANYEGIYANANALGMMAATWITGLLILCRGYIFSGGMNLSKKFFSLLLGLSILVALVLVVASSSRTSLLAVCMLFAIFVWTLLLDASKTKFWKIIATSLISIMLISTLMVVGMSEGGILDEQMKKFVSPLGVVSGREVLWETVLNEAAIIGYGNSNLERRLGEPAHNTHLEILHAKGIIGLIFRGLFDLMAIKVTYQLAVNKVREDAYAVGPFLMIMTYMIMGLTENVNGTLGSGIHMSFLLMIGVVLNYHEFN